MVVGSGIGCCPRWIECLPRWDRLLVTASMWSFTSPDLIYIDYIPLVMLP